MRDIRTIQDANAALKDVNDQLDKLRTQDFDLHKRRVKNASPSEALDDYVIKKELVDLTSKVQNLDNKIQLKLKQLEARVLKLEGA